MKTININTQEGISFLLYPDNQPHVNINSVNEADEVKVICSLKDSITVMHLLECANALDNLFAVKKELHIPYLMAARFDRLMQHGDSIDLQVVANLINSMNFYKVYLYDVHSDVSSMLIKNSINIHNLDLVKIYNMPNSVLICPDAGASKKVGKYLSENEYLTDVVYCTKERDLSNGRLSLKVLDPEKCKNRNCVIIDDLCDGGGTFNAISEQINPKHLTLMVTHGVFSKGFSELEKNFNLIITSNSYKQSYGSKIVKLVNQSY